MANVLLGKCMKQLKINRNVNILTVTDKCCESLKNWVVVKEITKFKSVN